MKTLYLLFFGTLLSLVHCTTISDFPECAQKCIYNSADALGGNANDLLFTCKSSNFLDAVHACEAATCSQSDISRLFRLAIQLCEPVGGTIAIGLGNLSSCAQPGLAIATTESGCSTTDWSCICTSSAYTIVAAEYEEQYCSPADRQAILDYTSTACSAVGVQLEPPSPGAPSGRPSSTSSSPSTTSSAASVYDFPQCALPCVDASLLQSGCQPFDWECICVNPAFIGGEAAFCELQSCSVEDQYRILNITGPQCSAIGEALVPATTFAQSSSGSPSFSGPLTAATVPLVFPTGNVQGSVPSFSNLPSCAQFCATNATTKAGGSVSDLELLCRNGPVLESIGACASALCSATDQETTIALTPKICEPVGNIASVNPTINPSAGSAVISSAYSTTTVATNLNNVAPCAKPCLVTAFNESGCSLDNIHCQCTSKVFAGLFTSCQAAVCGITDLQKLLPFTIERCGSIGIALDPTNLTIASDLAFQIPTSTDFLPTPTDLTNAPNDVASLPLCAQQCISDATSFSGCNIHNLTCICTSLEFASYVITCETAACTADELQVINAYAAGLCNPVPGHLAPPLSSAAISSALAKPTYTTTNSSLAGTGTLFPPKPTSFTGEGAMVKLRISDYVVGIVLWLGWTL